MKYFYIRRTEPEYSGNEIMTVKEQEIVMLLKRHPNWVVDGEVGKYTEKVLSKSRSSTFVECDVCGKQSKDSNELAVHKKNHK